MSQESGQENDGTPDFEAALKELETLVEKLESGDLKLDESLQHFRRGVELTRLCQQVLDQAQQTVEELMTPDDEADSDGDARSDNASGGGSGNGQDID